MQKNEISLEAMFALPAELDACHAVFGARRYRFNISPEVEVLLDRFDEHPQAVCAFMRLKPETYRTLRLRLAGEYGLDSSTAGGWLIRPSRPTAPAYWIPVPPILRRLDEQGHILAEQNISLSGLSLSGEAWVADIELPSEWHLDMVIWRLQGPAAEVHEGLSTALAVERQDYYLWGSKTSVRLPAGLYRFLVHGQVYTDDFVWPRRWKFHSELDAHGLYTALTGLEAATGKPLYGLLRRQVLLSVLVAQAEDGGWHQGEWTDLMEVHLRLHNAAMLILEAALEESGDDTLQKALARAIDFLLQYTDQTGIGLWFLHDSLETSPENMEIMREQTRTPWIPSRTLGKSPCNKLILNTHLDAIVALERYRRITGDDRHAEALISARNAARSLLNLRPAELIYQGLYKVIELTLLPKERAMRLPLFLRAVKRLTWMYLLPNMHRFKRIWPRLVMPGGLIERHIAPLHFDLNYHPVNVMDILRYQRLFPSEDFHELVDNAIAAVKRLDLLQYWSESKQRQFAVVVWTEALYHLCTLNPDISHREHLAAAMICAARTGLGLPPVILGGDAEAIAVSARSPCPSPSDGRLCVVNLTRQGLAEILVVNPHEIDLELAWERGALDPLTWLDQDGARLDPPLRVRAGGWILGRAPTPGSTVTQVNSEPSIEAQ